MTYDLSKAFLADKVYDKNLAKGQEFTDLDGATWTVVATKSDSATGYQGALFQKVNADGSAGKYVFASRGSESVKDVANDFEMGVGLLPDQMAVQRAFFEEAKGLVLKENGDPSSIEFVAHSLGGALIQALAAENPQNKADTFNAYGVGNLIEGSEGKTYSNITNHVMRLDGISVAPGSAMIGKTLVYGPSTGLNAALNSLFPVQVLGIWGELVTQAIDGVAFHLMSNFLNPELAASEGTPATIQPSKFGNQLVSMMESMLEGLAKSVVSTEQFFYNLQVNLEKLFSSATLNLGGNDALISELQRLFNTATTTISPLTLDLNGDGVVETTALSKSISTGAHFNLDAQGLSENTGWVSANDGLLVRDLNGDGQITSGRELFGNHTLLSKGQEAANGFEALQTLDSNADGVINSGDEAFASLQVWKDADGDGVTDAGELLSLEQAGVSSLNVSYTTGSTTDAQGNQHLQLGNYTTTSGATRKMDDIWFATEAARTQDHETVAVSDAIAALPDLAGMGNVRSLRQTMARDTSGQLQALVQQWKDGDATQRESVLDSLIFRWTGVQDVDPNSRGDFIGDARRLVA